MAKKTKSNLTEYPSKNKNHTEEIVRVDNQPNEVAYAIEIKKSFIITFLVIVSLVIVIALALNNKGSSDMDESSYNTYYSNIPTLIDLGSASCVPCQQLQPVLRSLATKYHTDINIQYYDIYDNAGDGPSLASEYGISSIPTLIFLNASGEEVYRVAGYKSEAEIEQIFENLGWN